MISKTHHKTTKSYPLKAAVMSSNDGILSISGLVIGVASTGSSKILILTAGLVGIVAGAISMAVGEYISISAIRDNERVLINEEEEELSSRPKFELNELASLYEKKGLKPDTAQLVAIELTSSNALRAHSSIELNIDLDNITNPRYSVTISAMSYIAGAAIPLFVVMLPIGTLSIPLTFISVIFALILTGYTSAKVSGSNKIKSIFRVVICGVLAMSITFTIGNLFRIVGI